MKNVVTYIAAGCLLASAAWVQAAPSKRARARTVKQTGRSTARPAIRTGALGTIHAASLSRTITGVTAKKLTALAQLQDKTFGAGDGQLGLLDEQGNLQQAFALPFKNVAALGQFEGGKLLAVDGASNTIFSVDPVGKKCVKLFAARELQGAGVENAQVLAIGKVAGVTSDGRGFGFIAVEAGYSSSIFEVDLKTKKLKRHAYTPGASPTALSFEGGKLFVVDRESSLLRCFDRSLKLSADRIALPVADARGLAIKGAKVKVLSAAKQGLVEFSTPLAVTSLAIAPWKLMTPVRVKIDPVIVTPLPRKFAVLICGDVAESGYDEFWNDTVWMYKTLRSAGYDRKYIYVLYGYGSDYPSVHPFYRSSETVTDFPATISKVTMVLNGLKNGDAANGIYKMTTSDSLFVWTFDHGGGGSTLCLRDGSMSKTTFSNLLNAVPYAKRAVFMQQCFSGGYVDTLKNAKTYVSTACQANETAHRADTEKEWIGSIPFHHGEYNYHIISALDKKKPSGSTVNADGNGNGKVSVKEAHTWNTTHENRSETPKSADPGGVGSTFEIK